MQDKLSKLHEMLCDELTRRLQAGEDLSPADLNVIRQFLKDNNVDALATDDSPLAEVLKSLPAEYLQ